MNHPLSDECLNALIDGELAPADAAPVLEQSRHDADLRERLSQLQLGKVLVRHAFEEVQPPQRSQALHGLPRSQALHGLPRSHAMPGPQRWHALAAGFAGFALLATSALLGWLAHDRALTWGDAPGLALSASVQPAVAVQAHAHQRIVVHLSEATQALSALAHAQGLLEAARASGRSVTVEIVANAGGLDLLREGVSEHAARIAALRAEYSALSLVACGRTVRNLRAAGADVRLLPGTLTASSALDEIVLRMQQGWAYVRV